MKTLAQTKLLTLVALMVFVFPQIALAAWWNPFSWFSFSREKSAPMQTREVETPAIVPAATAVSTSSTATSSKRELFNVIKVVDGDTIDVSINGKTERLRLIGIDTPETVDPRKPVQCFGVEASSKTKAMLLNKKVSLESDPTQGERDKYSRLLRYVFLEDGTNFNLLLINEGYAYEYTYALPYIFQSEFKLAQKNAEAKKKGLWATGVCDTEVKITPSPKPVVAPPPTPAPKIAPTPTQPQTSSQCNPNYSGCLKKNAGDYDCAGGSGNGPNYTGMVQVLGYDEYGLDRDGDGVACE